MLTPIIERTAWRDTAQGLTGAEVREDGPVPTGQVETGVIWGREKRGRRRGPAGWWDASHDETRGRARHGARTHRRGGARGRARPDRSGGDRGDLGRSVVGGVSRPDGWAHRLATHGAERDTAQGLIGAEVREHGPVPTGQVEIGVAWGRENRGRRREPAGSIPPKSMASSACRTSIWGPVVSGKRNVPASSRFAHTA
jgi:hypothetical protein